jgi:pimeloyl-ACP methyl ester carboxylesterase
MNPTNHAWIFLRGLSREKQHWGDFSDQFAQRFQTKVICIDMPGVGEYHQQKAPLDVQAWVQHISDALAQQHPNLNSVSILAYSMGAMVSHTWARQTKLNVQRMVWINTSFANLSPWYARMQWPVICSLPKFFTQFSNLTKREAWVMRWTLSTTQDRSALLQTWVDIQRKRPVSLANFFRHTVLAAKLKLTQKPACPVMILQSAKDQLVSPTCSKAIVNKLDCAHAVHPNAGHDLTLEDPEWVFEQLLHFVDPSDPTFSPIREGSQD